MIVEGCVMKIVRVPLYITKAEELRSYLSSLVGTVTAGSEDAVCKSWPKFCRRSVLKFDHGVVLEVRSVEHPREVPIPRGSSHYVMPVALCGTFYVPVSGERLHGVVIDVGATALTVMPKDEALRPAVRGVLFFRRQEFRAVGGVLYSVKPFKPVLRIGDEVEAVVADSRLDGSIIILRLTF